MQHLYIKLIFLVHLLYPAYFSLRPLWGAKPSFRCLFTFAPKFQNQLTSRLTNRTVKANINAKYADVAKKYI